MRLIYRHSAPTALDQAPLGSLCYVEKELSHDVYVQLSQDDTSPNWYHMGTFSLSALDSDIRAIALHILDES